MSTSTRVSSRTIEELSFDNRVLRALPLDGESENYVRTVRNACFSRVQPAPVENPVVVAVAEDALRLLSLSPDEASRPDLAQFLSGNKPIPGAEPAAHCYCGHQFGAFSGQLGDGAAMYLGEVINDDGERWEAQFKGAGPTPYSRSADGRKVLRSSVREFLCSEAMYHLGVPTTRAGAVVTSDSTVARDPLYDGRVLQERCSIVLRIAPTFLRFGSFEIFKPTDPITGRDGPSAGNEALKRQLLEFVIDGYFPDIAAQYAQGSAQRYAAFFAEVARSTAVLVAAWQTVGFVHGVLNTDNMSVLGLTLDYGPYAFMENFDEEFVPNGSDGGARYNYVQQPAICRWNLERFADVLSPFLLANHVQDALLIYDQTFQEEYVRRMRAKLGLLSARADDETLVNRLFRTMQITSADFTDTFRALTMLCGSTTETREEALQSTVRTLVSRCAPPAVQAKALRRKLQITRLSMPPQQTRMLYQLLQSDPGRISTLFGPSVSVDAVRREVEEEHAKLERLTGYVALVKDLEAHATDPARAEEKRLRDEAAWKEWLQMYTLRLVQDEELESDNRTAATRRVTLSGASNPTFVLRNWIAQDAVEAAESGDHSRVQGLLSLLRQPFSPALSSLPSPPLAGTSTEQNQELRRLLEQDALRKYTQLPPDWAPALVCTCSS